VTLLPTLARGGAALLQNGFDAAGFLELAERERATHTMLVPVQYRRLLDHPEFDRFDLSAFEARFSTGAPLEPGLKRELLERWPGRLLEIYGLTEGGCTCVLDAGAHPDKLDTVGRPAEGVEIAVLGEDGREVSRGEVGEIAGRSIGMMTGYRGRPDLTEAITWRDPEGRRFVRTGDLGSVDRDGFLHLHGRVKDVIISGGINLYPEDIERALLEHDDVVEAAVVAAPSARWGETPVAFVVLADRATAAAEEIAGFASSRLSRVQRIDRVVPVDELPRNEMGKVLRDELRRRV
jgi:acyl-CoA synthetase (AMP-forming)/AMP-acid ligase II